MRRSRPIDGPTGRPTADRRSGPARGSRPAGEPAPRVCRERYGSVPSGASGTGRRSILMEKTSSRGTTTSYAPWSTIQ